MVRTVVRKGRGAGLGVGNHFSDGIEPQIRWAHEGVHILINSSDFNAFYQSMSRDLAAMKEALGENAKPARAPTAT
ncbi:MAG: hypothetical protein M1457_11360 [bacterium]|nr:hypothetical protein [bacterium]